MPPLLSVFGRLIGWRLIGRCAGWGVASPPGSGPGVTQTTRPQSGDWTFDQLADFMAGRLLSSRGCFE